MRERKREKKVGTVRNRVAGRQRGEGRQPMRLDMDRASWDRWMGPWRLKSATGACNRDCDTGWFF